MAGKEIVGAVAGVIGALADGMSQPALLAWPASRLGTPRTRLLAITTSNAGPADQKSPGHRRINRPAPVMFNFRSPVGRVMLMVSRKIHQQRIGVTMKTTLIILKQKIHLFNQVTALLGCCVF